MKLFAQPTKLSRLLPLMALLLPFALSAAETNLFPIMPWNSPPNDLAVLQKIKECGFTVAGFVPPGGLDNCEKAGLKAIVSDARTSGYDWAASVDPEKAKSNVASLIGEVGKNPAVFG